MRTDTWLHGLKVLGFVAVSGALAGLVQWFGAFHPSTAAEVSVVAIINALLAMAVKEVNDAKRTV